MSATYRYATLALGESLQSPSACECCGRDGLKKTVKLVKPEGSTVWFGVGCAARALKLRAGDVEKARIGQREAGAEVDRSAASAAADQHVAARIARGWRPAFVLAEEARGARYEFRPRNGGWVRVAA